MGLYNMSTYVSTLGLMCLVSVLTLGEDQPRYNDLPGVGACEDVQPCCDALGAIKDDKVCEQCLCGLMPKLCPDLPFWSSSILVVFHFGRLPFWSSSISVVSHFGRLP